MAHGLPGVGRLPPFGWQGAGPYSREELLSVSELRASKRAYNETVLAKMRQQDWVQDIHKAVAEDQVLGAMGPPRRMQPEDVDNLGLKGCAYMRGVSESLEWARPSAGSACDRRASPTGELA